MNDKITISTHQLFAMFPDADTARSYLESRRWPNGVRCPVCESDRIGQHSPGFYRCNACKEAFTVQTGTVMERSKIPLHKWLYTMYLMLTSRKGISSMQLSKELGITQKSAWFMLHRLREACGKDLGKLRGVVEIDETFIGGTEANKHESKKLRQGRGSVGKAPVLGMRERGGRTIALPVEDVSTASVHRAIHTHVGVRVPPERREREATHHAATGLDDRRDDRQADHLCGVDSMKTPKALDRIADAVLAFRPKAKSKPAKKRARRRNKIQRKSSI